MLATPSFGKDLTFDTLNDFATDTMLGGSYGLVLVNGLAGEESDRADRCTERRKR